VCRAPLTEPTNIYSVFARKLLQMDVLEAKGIQKGANNLANSIESMIALFMHRLAANREADSGKWDPRQGNFAD
jgi:hypothetical protein